MKKKIAALICCGALGLSVLTGCGESASSEADVSTETAAGETADDAGTQDAGMLVTAEEDAGADRTESTQSDAASGEDASAGHTEGSGTEDTGASGAAPEAETAYEAETVSEPEPAMISMNEEEFEHLLSDLPLAVVSTEYAVQDEEYKSLYPDLLCAVLRNNTDVDIKDAMVAFVGWDENHLPVRIRGQYRTSGGDYLQKVSYYAINLLPGKTFGEDSGFAINEDCNIASFKAIVMSFDTFDGDTWENPYFEAWEEMYCGVKYTDELTAQVPDTDATFVPSEKEEDAADAIDGDALQAEIDKQDFRVTSTEYLPGDDVYTSLYPDILSAVVTNHTGKDIRDAVVAFAAWDANNLPVRIISANDYDNGDYVSEVSYSDMNLVDGASYGEGGGLGLSSECDPISTFKAIVVSYEDFDGSTWTNPLYDDWKTLYEGRRLK